MKNYPFVALIVAIVAAAMLPQPAGAQSYNTQTRYPNPSQEDTQAARKMGCADPWVALALRKVKYSFTAADCLVTLYNGGQWDSFNTLIHAVGATKVSFDQQGAKLLPAVFPGNKPAVLLTVNGQIVAAGGGNLIGQDAASIVAAGAGNLVPANFIGTGVGSLKIGAPGMKQLQSKGSVRLPSGALYY